MKRLLQINVTVNSGSTGRIAEEIGLTAINAGWKSFIAYGRGERPSRSEKIRIGKNADIRWHGLQTRLFDRHGLGSRQATEKFIRRIEEIKPDVIHLHNIHGYYINIEVLFRYLAHSGIPVVWTLHDCWSFTGHCAHFDYIGCQRWQNLCFNCPLKRVYPGSLFLDNSRKNYLLKKELFTTVRNMVIVPVSDWLKGLVQQSFLSRYPLYTIHNGIDTSIFSPNGNGQEIRAKYGIGDKFMMLGVANVWVKKKGLPDFMELSRLLGKDYKIVLVGLTPGQMKGLPENVIGITRTENTKALAGLYAAADLFVNPTWQDNFPTTNLEALACGTPIVTYRTGGSVEAVFPDTGRIVEKGDVQGILSFAQEIKETGKEKYTDRCRESAVGYFNKDDKFKEYIALYRTLI